MGFKNKGIFGIGLALLFIFVILSVSAVWVVGDHDVWHYGNNIKLSSGGVDYKAQNFMEGFSSVWDENTKIWHDAEDIKVRITPLGDTPAQYQSLQALNDGSKNLWAETLAWHSADDILFAGGDEADDISLQEWIDEQVGEPEEPEDPEPTVCAETNCEDQVRCVHPTWGSASIKNACDYVNDQCVMDKVLEYPTYGPIAFAVATVPCVCDKKRIYFQDYQGILSWSRYNNHVVIEDRNGNDLYDEAQDYIMVGHTRQQVDHVFKESVRVPVLVGDKISLNWDRSTSQSYMSLGEVTIQHFDSSGRAGNSRTFNYNNRYVDSLIYEAGTIEFAQGSYSKEASQLVITPITC
ncbi:hypothetical protein KAR91_36445 [Candidatus Pacearchaeota archaeon]|nr:hypothetical protein [Candidatus Pacearchaeota archaeon]